MESQLEASPTTQSSETLSPETVDPACLISIAPNGSANEALSNVEVSRAEDVGVKKRGRKGHSKSRAGCLNCKRARIKCKENHPSCDYCAHRGLNCEWPEIHVNQIGSMIRRPSRAPSMVVEPQFQLPVYTAQDFRFFDYFLQGAYPHQPIGNDAIWTHEIPILAPNHDYLLHAILALGAAELASYTLDPDPDLTLAGIIHRVKAIEALNRAVSRGIQTMEEGNAMIGTCYALLFQSVLMNDGLTEYMSFIRGTVAIIIHMAQNQMKFLFHHMQDHEQMEQIDPMLYETPLIDAEAVGAACRSLEKMAPLCTTKIEIQLYGLLLNMARTCITSSRDAYVALRKFYNIFIMMPYDEFREFTNPENEVCRLIQAHFVAMQLIMTPISKVEWAGKAKTISGPHSQPGRWITPLHASIPPHMREYYEWTLWVEKDVYEGGEHGPCSKLLTGETMELRGDGMRSDTPKPGE